MDILINVALIAIIVALFNLIIFVHELGHFLAARWRGLQVDRFQIWFGKPIWKKEHNGVQYGLGWLPFGGFVALPQMAPMESIEGENLGEDGKPLPKVKPLDKIIVALAGPIFSMLLALAAAVTISFVGKPRDFVETTEIGFVAKDSPAHKAGLLVGDEILKINGEEVDGFLGSLDSVQERIMLSKGNEIEFVVNRPGEAQPLTLISKFDIKETRWWQRSGLRRVGIWVPNTAIIHAVQEDSPAERAGLEPGDIITKVNGETLTNFSQFMSVTSQSPNIPVALEVERDGKSVPLTITPLIPTNNPKKDAKVGAVFGNGGEVDVKLVKPSPLEQVGDSVRMMWVTITSVLAKDSSIGAEHLAGPVGIGSVMFDLLLSENGWRRLITFLVLFNVNLAILNMLPLPVLDGGHVVLSLGEMVAGRPVKAKILEIVQTAFAMVLLCFFLYITSKDIGDKIRPKSPSKWIFPEQSA
ncbi:MAG: RIP metalloprotease RseP [Akkermansiaceae bacterium]|nr:RIP metalloprotease RseP [Akkermansiaceae bacterium]|tara:strand:- start:711 stop:2120 length:1410 start_codon:yes stop_codon:yes gene_type:complete